MHVQPTIDQERQRKAGEYARIRHILLFAQWVVVAMFLIGLLLSGASAGLREMVLSVSGNLLVAVSLYFLVFYIAYSLITLPFSLYGGFVLGHRFGLSRQTFASWMGDWLKSSLLSLLMALLFVEVLYLLLSLWPQTWWILAGIGLVLFSVILANLTPVILVPLFYKLRPLEDEALVNRLISLAERAGARVGGVYTIDMSSKTTAANAALMGLGNTRRIVLGDTLLQQFTNDEIVTVMAHELGHHVHRDIPKLIAIQSLTTFVSLYLANLVLQWASAAFLLPSLADLTIFPLLVLTLGVVNLALMPLTNAFSRHVEAQADAYALQLTEEPEAFAGAMTRLANLNLAEVRPARWAEMLLHDHPPIGRRLEAAEAYLDQRQR